MDYSVRIAGGLITGARRNGGATVSTTGKLYPEAYGGFIVAVSGNEYTLPDEGMFPAALEWVDRVRPAAVQGNYYLGSWRNPEGRIVLDVVEVVTDCGVALMRAHERGETAIWDVASGEEIDVARATCCHWDVENGHEHCHPH